MKKYILSLAAFSVLAVVLFMSFDDSEAVKQMEELKTMAQERVDEFRKEKQAECDAKALVAARPLADSMITAAKNEPIQRVAPKTNKPTKAKKPTQATPVPSTPSPAPAPEPAPPVVSQPQPAPVPAPKPGRTAPGGSSTKPGGTTTGTGRTAPGGTSTTPTTPAPETGTSTTPTTPKKPGRRAPGGGK